VNRDRTTAGNTVGYRTGNFQRLSGIWHATIRNRKRYELDSPRPAKRGFSLQSKLGNLVAFEKAYDHI
jgi:hypothetical protein